MAARTPTLDRQNQIQDSASRFQMDKFQTSKDDWDYYIQQFETQLSIHNLMDESASVARRNLLLSQMGTEPFKMLIDRFRPDPLTAKSYHDLKCALQNYYGKKTCVMSDRLSFMRRYRGKNESIVEYLNQLRAIAARCRFGQSQNERLRDQLIMGINQNAWQQELLRQFPSEDANLQQVESAAVMLEQSTVQQRMQSLTVSQSGDTAPKNVQKHTKRRGFTPRPMNVGITNVNIQHQPNFQNPPQVIGNRFPTPAFSQGPQIQTLVHRQGLQPPRYQGQRPKPQNN